MPQADAGLWHMLLMKINSIVSLVLNSREDGINIVVTLSSYNDCRPLTKYLLIAVTSSQAKSRRS